MEKFVKEFKKATVIGIILWVVLLLLSLFQGNSLPNNDKLLLNFVYTLLYTIILYSANAILFMYLDKKFSKDRFSLIRLIIGFITSIPISTIVVFFLRFIDSVIVREVSVNDFFKNESITNYINTIIITIIISLLIHLVYLYKAYQENRLKEQKIIAGTASAKFESLKNQIDPHFLFNSLNVLSSLIEENPDNAQRFTTSLSKIYRYVLEQKDKELVTVEEELAFAKTYMNLLKMRFENSISYELPVGYDNLEAKVVPLSLQLLLENTIKHNVVSEQKPLHIKIFIKNNYLVVQNDLQKKQVMQSRKGVGLQNIVDRYGIITNRKVLIDQNEQTFTIKIPILTKQISVMETISNYSENSAYYRAKKRVEELRAFYGNLISYCCVIPILIFINLTYSPQFQWFWFSVLGWGFGLTMHAFKAFGYGSNWEERKIREIMGKNQNKKNWN